MTKKKRIENGTQLIYVDLFLNCRFGTSHPIKMTHYIQRDKTEHKQNGLPINERIMKHKETHTKTHIDKYT